MEDMMKKKEPVSVYNAQGEIRQCNEGRYEFKYSDSSDKTCVILEVWLPKFMDTSLINIDLNPQYIRIEVKTKVTQLKHPDDILVEKSKVQRSMTTGVLTITMPRSDMSESEAKSIKTNIRQEEQKKEQKLRELENQQRDAKEKQRIAQKNP